MQVLLVSFLFIVARASGQEPVAVVESVSGHATIVAPGARDKVAISSYDPLIAGTTIEVGTGSRLTLFFWNGRYYELGSGAKSTVASDALTHMTGPARQLESLPPIPKPAPIAKNTATGFAAPSIRGPKIQNLSPRNGVAELPDAVTLSFTSLTDTSVYNIFLEDDTGNILLNVKTASPNLAVPQGTLKPGSSYHWRVRTADAIGTVTQGSADFVTLPAEAIDQRAAFAKAVKLSPENAAALALMGNADLRLGLIREAQNELSAALKLNPEDAAIRRALDRALEHRF
jgi:tetratricopeptide (TPR) repeat protein